MFKNNVKILLYFVFLFLITRFFILFTSLDKVYDVETLYVGVIPKEILEGLKIPLFDYQYGHEAASSILIGILTVPFYFLFGGTCFTIKSTVLLISFFNFILWYIFAYIFFNKRVAIFLATLFILAPPLWIRFSSFAAPLVEPLTTLAIFFFFQAIYGNSKETKQGIYYFIAMGLVSGLAIWIYIYNIIPILICLLFWFALDKCFFFKKYFFAFLVSLIIGLSPWIYYNIIYHFAGLDRYDKPLYSLLLWKNIFYSFQGLKDFIIHILPNSFWLADFGFIKKVFLNATYNLIFIISFFALSWTNSESLMKLTRNIFTTKKSVVTVQNISRETFILFYIIVFVLIYNLFNFIKLYGYSEFLITRHFRFLLPIFPFIFLTIALFLDKIW